MRGTKIVKKLSLLIALSLFVTIGGVYATWNYAQGDAAPVQQALDGVTILTDKEVDAVAKGNIGISLQNVALTIDDASGDHYGELTKSGTIAITFTPSQGADDDVAEYGIPLQYALSCIGSEFIYDGAHIFEFSTDPVPLNDGNPTKSATINVADLEIALNSEHPLYLPTSDDYDAFYAALHSGSLVITVSEYVAP